VPLALLAFSVGPSARADGEILHRFAIHDQGAAHLFSTTIVDLAEPLPFLAILGAIVLFGLAVGRRRETIAAVAVAAGATLTTQVLKHLLEHPRVVPDLAGFHQPWADSFPSGHTTAAAALAVAAVLVAPPAWRAATAAVGVAFAGGMCLAVMVLQWHFPSDVLGGLLVVASWGFAAVAALRLLRPRDPDSPPREERETASGPLAVSLQ
jgi:membrane-associated phospholipid phosphatase